MSLASDFDLGYDDSSGDEAAKRTGCKEKKSGLVPWDDENASSGGGRREETLRRKDADGGFREDQDEGVGTSCRAEWKGGRRKKNKGLSTGKSRVSANADWGGEKESSFARD